MAKGVPATNETMRLPEDKIEEIREATDIVALISEYVTLRKKGQNHFGLCPFHEEKTPSFSVHADRQIFHCFGCGKGGNAISFLMEIEKLNFIEAVRVLAQKVGIELPRETERSDEDVSEAEQLAKANALACEFFHQQLLSQSTKGAEQAQKHLALLGYSSEIIQRYKIGYAPDSWEAFISHARSKGFETGIFVRAGLLKEGRETGKPYDAFRNRLMFPIRNLSGRVVAFGGRTLSEDADTAKYINSPETAIYHKGKVLFGLWEARNAIRKNSRALLVEGYTDLITPAATGVENIVASLGTALTSEQARLLRRFAPEVVILYDGDNAGRSAARRAVDVLLTEGLSALVVVLPEGKDPDSFVRSEGVEALWEHVNNALSSVKFQMLLARGKSDTLSAANRTAAIRALLETARLITKPVEQEIFLQDISVETGVALDALRKALPRRTTPSKSRKTTTDAPQGFQITAAQFELVKLLVRAPDLRSRIFGDFDLNDIEDETLRPLAEKIEELSLMETEESIEKLLDYFPDNPLRDFITKCLTEPPPDSDPQKTQAIFTQLTEDCLRRIKLDKVKTQIRSEIEKLTAAQKQNEPTEEFLTNIQNLRREEKRVKDRGKEKESHTAEPGS